MAIKDNFILYTLHFLAQDKSIFESHLISQSTKFYHAVQF